MSFNLREWCQLHRAAVAAVVAELADLRKFVSANVLNADEAARVLAKIGKAEEKFAAVEASGESLILAFEADCSANQGAAVGSESGEGDGTGSIHDESLSIGKEPAIAVSTEPATTGILPGTLPDTVQGSAPAGTGEGSQGALADSSQSSAPEAPATTAAPSGVESPAGNSGTGEGTGSAAGSGSGG